ncbi:DNA-directed DNA polymerase [Tanacetum coccineum]|uniref:DNA-directed DNA polymerase n=1 Tax=Tanacetum coccineum TaxID=301880 RepID=A0ABQ5ACL5_9ASTR
MITYGLCQRTTGYEKIQRNDLWLLSMFEDRHQNGYANVAWVIAKWMKRKGARSQKDSQICCGQFISKIARKSRVLTEEIIRSLSTPVYCRDLDRTTLRELIDSEDRLIPDIPVDDVQRVAAQRAPRVVFEHMAGVYSVPLQGAYNPPGYAQPQYDQYYQQYYPQQPPQQQHDDEEDEYNMDSSIGNMCLEKDVIEISRSPPPRNEGSGDWDSPEYKDTTGSGGKKEPEALVFHKMYTEEDSDRYIAQCFVNGLYASDGEINLEKNENLISNDYAVKLCLEYEVRKGKKLVKKELMVLLRGEIYFVQFIINPEEDEFEPGLIFGRSFLRSAKGIVNFGEGTITIQPDFDPFLLSSDEEKNPNLDDLETLLDFDFDEEPQTETDLPPLVCKMGKGSRNKKKVMENIMYFNNGAGPSSSFGTPLTQEEAEKRALAHNIGMRLDGMIKPEEERVMVKVKGHMLKEKKDPRAFLFPIRLEGRINENALADTGSDTNTMPYRIYEQLGRDDIMKEERNITMINYTEAEVTGRLVNVLCQVGFTTLSAKFLILEIPVDRDAPIVVGHGFLDTIRGNINIPNMIFTTFDGLARQTFRAARSEKIRTAESDSDDEEDYVIKRNKIGTQSHNL